jgi:hypothetical protein
MHWPVIEVALFAGLTALALVAVIALVVLRNGRNASRLAKH